jgi:hypothetical protein
VPKPVRKRPKKIRTTPGQWLESSESNPPNTEHFSEEKKFLKSL